MSGMYAFTVLVDPRCHDRVSYRQITRLVTQSSISNFADGQISCSLPRALQTPFPKLRTVPVITLQYDPLLLPWLSPAQREECLDITVTRSCAHNPNICVPCDEYVDV